MSGVVRRAVVALLVLTAAAPVATAYGQEITDPTVSVDRTGTAAGEDLLVTGGGWPAGATLAVELCGRGGLGGSIDCDLPHQRTAGVGSSGSFSVVLTSDEPPTPCPCVIKATDQTTGIAATAPIAVAGIATVPITGDEPGLDRSVEVSGITVTGGPKVGELFGLGGQRVLELTLVNTGAVAVDAPDLTIVWGTGDDPDGFVRPPDTDALEPGETQTVTVALDRPPMTLGEQTAVVEVQGFGEPIVARASTSGYPWGLLAVALVLVQLVLLRLRNRYRRRRARRDGRDEGDGADGAATPSDAPRAVDPTGETEAILDLTEAGVGVRPGAAEAAPPNVSAPLARVTACPWRSLDAEHARLKARLTLRQVPARGPRPQAAPVLVATAAGARVASRAPRLGSIEQRVADAVSQAVSSTLGEPQRYP